MTDDPTIRARLLRTRIVSSMATDAEKWRFLADNKLTLHTTGDGYMVHYYKADGLGKPPKFYPVSNGKTADEAIEAAMKKWKRKSPV